MSEIDDIFKNNLHNKGLTYSETYWQNMEKLLDREKRRKFFLRAGVLAFVLLNVLLWSVLYFTLDKAPQRPALAGVQKSTISPGHKVDNTEIEVNENVETTILKQHPTVNLKDASKHEHKELNQETDDNSADLSLNEKVESKQLTVIPAIIPVETITHTSEKSIQELQEIDEGLCLIALRTQKTERIPFENMLIAYHPDFKPAGRIPVLTSEQQDSIKKLSKWQFYAATGYEYDKYSRTSNTSLLKENEKTLNRSGFNVNFIAKKKNWGLKSGLGILQLSELTNYVTVNKHYSFDTSYRMINPNYEQTSRGSKIALIKRNIDTTISQSSSINSPDSRVSFTYLKIPLMATYEFRLKRIRVFMDAGLNTAFLINAKGNYTSYENNRFVVQNMRENNDMSKVLFQSSATLGVKYRIGKSLNVFGGYGVSRSLNSMTRSYDQKPKINLFTFGLEIKL